MLNHELNNNLISAVKNKLPQGTNLANALMDMLFIGREAVYRRLRGEVPFTFAEATLISRRLDIPLDSLAGDDGKGYAVFDVYYSYTQEDINAYCSMIQSQVAVYSKLAEDEIAQLQIACNILPFMLVYNYAGLSKFLLFKWLYQRGTITQGTNFEAFELPPNLTELHRQYVAAVRNLKHVSCIFDHTVFDNLLSNLKYFYNIGLLNAADMAMMKNDLLAMVDELEGIAAKGHFHTGKDVQLYISSVNFDCSYGHISGQNIHMAIIKICSVNLISSTEIKLFEQMKVWIDSLRKFSTLISQSGEMQRISFFNKQRASINSL